MSVENTYGYLKIPQVSYKLVVTPAYKFADYFEEKILPKLTDIKIKEGLKTCSMMELTFDGLIEEDFIEVSEELSNYFSIGVTYWLFMGNASYGSFGKTSSHYHYDFDGNEKSFLFPIFSGMVTSSVISYTDLGIQAKIEVHPIGYNKFKRPIIDTTGKETLMSQIRSSDKIEKVFEHIGKYLGTDVNFSNNDYITELEVTVPKTEEKTKPDGTKEKVETQEYGKVIVKLWEKEFAENKNYSPEEIITKLAEALKADWFFSSNGIFFGNLTIIRKAGKVDFEKVTHKRFKAKSKAQTGGFLEELTLNMQSSDVFDEYESVSLVNVSSAYENATMSIDSDDGAIFVENPVTTVKDPLDNIPNVPIYKNDKSVTEKEAEEEIKKIQAIQKENRAKHTNQTTEQNVRTDTEGAGSGNKKLNYNYNTDMGIIISGAYMDYYSSLCSFIYFEGILPHTNYYQISEIERVIGKNGSTMNITAFRRRYPDDTKVKSPKSIRQYPIRYKELREMIFDTKEVEVQALALNR